MQQAELEAAGLEDGEEDEEGGDDEGERCCLSGLCLSDSLATLDGLHNCMMGGCYSAAVHHAAACTSHPHVPARSIAPTEADLEAALEQEMAVSARDKKAAKKAKKKQLRGACE